MTGPPAGAGLSGAESVRPGIPRAAEAVVALAGLVLSAPLLTAAAIVIAMTSRGPVFFRQERVGRCGRVFLLYKLRTMRHACGGPEVTASDDARITRFGRFLRKTKLDELPQLWNVLRGEMSFVGPRPEVAHYVDLSSPLWKEVLQVRPGITDPVALRLSNEEALLAKVKGDRERFYRQELQPRKLREYLSYLRQRSWRTDVQILCKTGFALLLRRSDVPKLTDIRDSSGNRRILRREKPS